MFEDFNFDILKDKDFKEDSVREELILPILKKLGYSATGENRIIRSKAIEHPFVYIGSKKQKISIIPDYLLKTKNNIWVLEAKSPKEKIISGKNVEQAFSYAIHKDIRSTLYALCNGYKFVVFHINKEKPIINLTVKNIDKNWNIIYQSLSPLALDNPKLLNFKPDYGITLLKLGVTSSIPQYFYNTPTYFIVKVEDDLYTIFLELIENEEKFAISFDFSKKCYEKLLDLSPHFLREKIKRKLSMQPYSIEMYDSPVYINIEARLSQYVIRNNDEEYLPLKVTKFTKP